MVIGSELNMWPRQDQLESLGEFGIGTEDLIFFDMNETQKQCGLGVVCLVLSVFIILALWIGSRSYLIVV